MWTNTTVGESLLMPHVGQETLRIYPIIIDITRAPKKDDILPLSKPVTGVSGKGYKELFVPAGTIVTISPVAYNLYVRTLHLPCRNCIIRDEFSRFAGTRTSGDQMPMNFDRNDGLR